MTELPRRTLLGGAIGLTAAAAAPALAQQGGGGSGGAKPTPPSSAAQERPPTDPAKPLAGKVALVTGAARGIGAACALELARMGADIALVDIAQPDALKGVLDYPLASRADLAQSEAKVRAEGVRTASAVADTRRFDQMQAAVAKASAALGGIDILVAVAGVDHGEDDLDHYSEAKYAAIVDTNLHGTLNTVRAALPQIERRQGGRIVMIASLAGRRGNEKYLCYTASKWGVIGLMKGLAQELGPKGIAVNCVAPSGVATVLYEKSMPAAEYEKKAGEGTVLPVSILQPADIADAVGFLVSPKAKWISGATIDVNGGRSAMLNA